MKERLNELLKLKNETDELVNTMKQRLENENVSKEMKEVQSKVADKKQVFEGLRVKYLDVTRRIEDKIGQRKTLLSQIELFAADIGKGDEEESKWTEVKLK